MADFRAISDAEETIISLQAENVITDTIQPASKSISIRTDRSKVRARKIDGITERIASR